MWLAVGVSPLSRGGFYLYNALFESISRNGAPSTTSVTLQVRGSGFTYPGLPGGQCSYRLQAQQQNLVISTPLQVLSPTLGVCSTPAAGIHGAVWSVALQTNGIVAEPTLFGALQWVEYDLEAVVITKLAPRGGPSGERISLTIHGERFADYGAGQLLCRVTNNPPAAVFAVTSSATLLDASRVVCPFVAPSFSGLVQVSTCYFLPLTSCLSPSLPLPPFHIF